MMKTPATDPALDMASEYDFSKGIRGKYAKRFPPGSKVVMKATNRVKHPAQEKGNRG